MVSAHLIRRVGVSACVLAAFAGVAAAAVPTAWTFKIVARDGASPIGIPPSNSLQADPAIDDAGNAFARYSNLFDDSDGIVRYRASTGDVATIASSSGGNYVGEIDSNGSLVAMRTFDSTIEVRDLDGALVTTFGAGGSEGVTGAQVRCRLTASGRLGYRAQAGSDVKYILDDAPSGGPRTQVLYDVTGPSTSFLFSPTTNASGQMAACVNVAGASEVRFYQNGGAHATIFTTGGNPTFNAIAGSSDLSDNGNVAFYARRPPANRFELRVMNSTGGNQALIADPNGAPIVNTAFTNFTPSINNNRIVAFRCRDASGTAVYLGDGGAVFKLLGEGMSIDTNLGSVTLLAGGDFAAGNVYLNNNNQLVCIARLSDGSRALLIATPGNGACQPADIADDQGNPLPSALPNTGVNEGDYNAFFGGFFDALAYCDQWDDQGNPLPSPQPNTGVNEGDYNGFFATFFNGCP